MLWREPVFHRHHRDVELARYFGAEGLVRVDVAEHEAAAVEEDHHRTRFPALARVEQAERDISGGAGGAELAVHRQLADRSVGHVPRGVHHAAAFAGAYLVAFGAGKRVQIIEEAADVGPDIGFRHLGFAHSRSAAGALAGDALPSGDAPSGPPPIYVAPVKADGQFPWDKYGLLMAALEETVRIRFCIRPNRCRASGSRRCRSDYVAEVFELRVPREKERRIGFPVSQRVSDRARRTPGGTWLAAKLALRHGFAANTAAGAITRCTTPAPAIASSTILPLPRTGSSPRETQDASSSSIATSIRGTEPQPCWRGGRGSPLTRSTPPRISPPGRPRSTLDIALADGTGDEAYLEALASSLSPLVASFGPDLILYQAGVDVHAEDKLAV
jgi:hypothetical protein